MHHSPFAIIGKQINGGIGFFFFFFFLNINMFITLNNKKNDYKGRGIGVNKFNVRLYPNQRIINPTRTFFF